MGVWLADEHRLECVAFSRRCMKAGRTELRASVELHLSKISPCIMTFRCAFSSDLPVHKIGPRGPVSGNGRTWLKPNGSGRREIWATGSGGRVSI